MAFALFLFSPDAAIAQQFLNPNVGGCSIGTSKTVVDRGAGGNNINLPGDGTVGTITFDTDGINDGNLDAEVTGFCKQEGNKVTVFARGRVINTASPPPNTSNVQAGAGFSLNLRPHAKPINTIYLLRATADFKVTWKRGDAGDPGGASAGLTMTNCIEAGNPSISVSAGSAAQGVAVSSGTLECRRNSSNVFGFLESDVPISFGANVHQFAGNPQEFTFEGSVVFELLRRGKELQIVSGPTEGTAGAPFPEPFVVRVIENRTKTLISGEPIQFRLLDSSGAEVQTAEATTAADGLASANFTPPAGGVYKVEAVCAGCPASSQELGQGSKVVFPEVNAEAKPAVLLDLRKKSGDGPTGVGRDGDNPLVALVFNLSLNKGEDGVPVEFVEVSHPGIPLRKLQPQGLAPTVDGGLAVANFAVGDVPGDYVVAARCPACAASGEVLFTINARRGVSRPARKADPIDPSLRTAVFDPPNIRLGYGKTTRVCLRGGNQEFLAGLVVSSLFGGITAKDAAVSEVLPDCIGRTIEIGSRRNVCVLSDKIIARAPSGQIVARANAEAVLPSSEEAVLVEANIGADCSLLEDQRPFLVWLFGRAAFQCGIDRYKLILRSEFDLTNLILGERVGGPRPITAIPGLPQCPSPPVLQDRTPLVWSPDDGGFIAFDVLGGGVRGNEICGVEYEQTIFVGACAFKRNRVQYGFLEGGGGVRTRRSDHADGLFR